MNVEINIPDLIARLSGARGIFVAGTDTGIGKTVIACALIRALSRHGLRVAGMKPVAAGAEHGPAGLRNEDALALAATANIPAPYEDINPYCLVAAVSPHIAAADGGVNIDPLVIRDRYGKLAQLADFVVVEGAGGWLAPIGAHQTMADVAEVLDLPVLLVVGLRLGCLNHALLTRRAVEASRLQFAGWIGNVIDPGFERQGENVETLERMLGAAPIALIDHKRGS